MERQIVLSDNSAVYRPQDLQTLLPLCNQTLITEDIKDTLNNWNYLIELYSWSKKMETEVRPMEGVSVNRKHSTIPLVSSTISTGSPMKDATNHRYPTQ